jgi:hypothetical protein
VGEVVVAVVGEAELQDLAADVVGEAAAVDGGVGGVGLLVLVAIVLVVGEAGEVRGVPVDANEGAIGCGGGAGARAELERGGVAGLAVALGSAHGDGGGDGGRWRAGVAGVRVPIYVEFIPFLRDPSMRCGFYL